MPEQYQSTGVSGWSRCRKFVKQHLGGSLRRSLKTIQVLPEDMEAFDQFVEDCQEHYGVRLSRSDAFSLLLRAGRRA